MITHKSPYDYEKRVLIVSQLVRVCAVCGNYAYIRGSDEKRVCISCGSENIVEVWEHDLGTFRNGLLEKEHEKALWLVGMLKPQMDDFLQAVGEALNDPFYLDEAEIELEQLRQAAEIASDLQWLGLLDVLTLTQDYEGREPSNVEFGSAAWFAGIPEEQF